MMAACGEFSNVTNNRTWPEKHLFDLFRILQPLTQNYLKATHLLPNLPFLRSSASKITKTERKCSLDANKLLFNLIVNCEEPEKWNKFAHALKEAEFQSLYKVCHVCERRDFVYSIEIFDLLCIDFSDNGVDILNLSMGMLQLNSLSQSQFERIKIVFYEGGESAAILEFLSCLPDSMEIWLQNLLACLYGINKINLCQIIKKKGSEINIYTHGDLEILFQKYQQDIIQRVRPQDIKLILKTYDLIPDMASNFESPMDEMQKIFSHIEKRQVAGKWRSFVNALDIAGYECLSNKLTEETSQIDDEKEIQQIKVMMPQIVKRIDMNFELLSQVKNLLINERCAQEINRKKNEFGDIAAADMLLYNIHRFKNGWYHKFLKILTNVGQEDLALQIEPDLRCILKSSENLFEIEDESKYLSCPKKFDDEDEDLCCSNK